jgi:sortase family protein
VSLDVAAEERRRRRRWIVLAVALAVVGAVCFGTVLARSGPDDPSPRTPAGAAPSVEVETISPAPAPTTPVPKTPRADPRVPPVSLSIPAIGVSKDLLTLGLRPDKTVEVPSSADADFPGWYRLGPTPGQLGSAVILGHVDSVRGPAVFYQLRNLRPGSRVDVRLQNGATAHFAVRRVATYPNDEFPARKVYASRGVRALNLVTCGGAYDKARGGYQSNVVAYTRLVDITPPKAQTSQS